MSFLRRFLILILVALGIGSPWLVRDWLEAKSGSPREERIAGVIPRWVASLRERIPGLTSRAIPAGSEEASDISDRREPYPLAERTVRIVEGLFGLAPSALPVKAPSAETPRSRAIVAETSRRLAPDLATAGLVCGDPVVLRLFKEEGELEVWMKPSREPLYTLFKIHRIAAAAGRPGPKLREGDGQAPEGFYALVPAGLSPGTRHHLGLDFGYPNELDRALGRTGGEMMIHGGESAAGSFALAPAAIEEVYTLVEGALRGGQESVPVHLLPFRLTDARMDEIVRQRSPWTEHWINLKEGYDFFENVRLPPATAAVAGRNVFRLARAGG